MLKEHETELLVLAHGEAARVLADLTKSYNQFREKTFGSAATIGLCFRPFTIDSAHRADLFALANESMDKFFAVANESMDKLFASSKQGNRKVLRWLVCLGKQ
jgi:hypothetical protein